MHNLSPMNIRNLRYLPMKNYKIYEQHISIFKQSQLTTKVSSTVTNAQHKVNQKGLWRVQIADCWVPIVEVRTRYPNIVSNVAMMHRGGCLNPWPSCPIRPPQRTNPPLVPTASDSALDRPNTVLSIPSTLPLTTTCGITPVLGVIQIVELVAKSVDAESGQEIMFKLGLKIYNDIKIITSPHIQIFQIEGLLLN